jgi:inorganic pyrophosphatase
VRNDRFVAVVETPYNPPAVQALQELSAQELTEIEHFFMAYNQLEGREFRPLGRRGPEQAQEILETAIRTHARGGCCTGKSRRRAKQ